MLYVFLATATADVYSFGVVLWEMVTQQRPYEGMDAGRGRLPYRYQQP